MSVEVKIPENASEPFDYYLNLFKKQLNKDGILIEYKKRMFYEKPSEKRHKKYIKRKRKLKRKKLLFQSKRKYNLKWIFLKKKKKMMQNE